MSTIGERKSLLARFRVFTEKCPIQYKAFAFRKSEYPSAINLASRMKKDLELFLQDNLGFFQQYDSIKVYYDDGQKIVRDSIHTALEETLSKDAIIYKDAAPKTYRLFQMADYICGIKLTAIRYERHEQGSSERSFFGDSVSLKKNWLKKLRRKQLD